MDHIADLASALKQNRLMLFVGAGVPANLGLPLWSSIIDEMARQLGYDPEIFRQMGDHYLLAEFYTTKNKIGALRSWMDVEFHRSTIDIKKSRVYQLIVEL